MKKFVRIVALLTVLLTTALFLSGCSVDTKKLMGFIEKYKTGSETEGAEIVYSEETVEEEEEPIDD